MTDRAKRILIAEDEEADVLLMQIALEELGLADEWAVVQDGKQALDYLNRRGNMAERPAGNPELMLLDLKLPKVNGLEVIEAMKKDAGFNDIQVVIFSSSLDENDRAQALAMGAADFMVKPMDFNKFRGAIRKAVTSYLIAGK